MSEKGNEETEASSEKLDKLVKYTKITSAATCTMCAVLIICALIVVPKTMSVMGKVETEMAEISSFTDTISDTLKKTNEIASGINGIDFDSLSASINGLSEAVANITNLFH